MIEVVFVVLVIAAVAMLLAVLFQEGFSPYD